MQFVYPSFLFALAAIGVPIIIHLFHFRRYKKIVFSDVRFLKQVQEETRSRQRVKELLILISRVLAITFLVLLFAQPFIPNTQMRATGSAKAASIYIDNSFSMGMEGKEGILFESAKNKARSIVNGYSNDAQFQVLNNDFEGRQQRLLNRNDALKAIDEMKTGPGLHTLAQVISRQKQAFENTGSAPPACFIISDFQKNFLSSQLTRDSLVRLHFVPVRASVTHNLFIDSAWLATPVLRINTPVHLKVRLRNISDETAENVGITMKLAGVQKAMISLSCAPNSFADGEMVFTVSGPAWLEGELDIIDHPMVFDDKLFFTLRSSSSSRILCINGNGQNEYINKVFGDDPSYQLTNTDQSRIDYASFANRELIILNEPSAFTTGLAAELKKYVEKGGILFVVPPAGGVSPGLNLFLSDINTVQYGQATRQPLKVNFINTKEELFADVFLAVPRNIDLPAVSQHYETNGTTRSSGTALMKLNNGGTFMHGAAYRKGRIFLLTTPLRPEWSNLGLHSVFVPVMLKLALGTGLSHPLYFTIAGDKWVQADDGPAGSEKLARIQGPGVEMMTDITQREGKSVVYIDQQIKKAGIYKLGSKDAQASPLLFAMNYPRAESYTQMADEKEIARVTGAQLWDDDSMVLQQKIASQQTGTGLWRLCALLALVFVLIEILLLKLL